VYVLVGMCEMSIISLSSITEALIDAFPLGVVQIVISCTD
jgi:hypothetical protein